MIKVISVYQIEYTNGMKQRTGLISHNDYLNIIIPYEKAIYELERANKFKETNESKIMKKELKWFFGSEWFTDKSPLYYAISTGILSLPSTQGGEHKCKFTLL